MALTFLSLFVFTCAVAYLSATLAGRWADRRESESYIDGYMDAMDDMEAARKGRPVNRTLRHEKRPGDDST